MTRNIIFQDATTAFLAGLGFKSGRGIGLHVGGQKRHGIVDAREWVGIDVRLTPVAAYRDFRRAEEYAARASDSAPEPTGRRFIQPMACRDGRPVWVVLFERYE